MYQLNNIKTLKVADLLYTVYLPIHTTNAIRQKTNKKGLNYDTLSQHCSLANSDIPLNNVLRTY